MKVTAWEAKNGSVISGNMPSTVVAAAMDTGRMRLIALSRTAS